MYLKPSRTSTIELFARIANDFRKHCAWVSSLIKLQEALKKRPRYRCFLVNFAKFLRTLFYGKPPFDCFWIEYKYNDTKMKRINTKHNYIIPHFIQFKKSFFYRAFPVAASGHLHYFLSLLFLTFSISPFRSSHWEYYVKKLFLKFWIFTGKHLCWGHFLIKFGAEGLLKSSCEYSCSPIAVE